MDDLFLLSSSLLLTTLSLILGFLYTKHKHKNEAINLPPGSFGLPVIGESIQFLYGNPNKFIKHRMAKHSPHIFKTHILGEPTVVLCGPAGNKFLFGNEHKLFTSWRPHSMQKLVRSYQSTAPPPPLPADSGETDTKVLRSPGFLKPEALSKYMGKLNVIAEQHIKMHWEGKVEVEAFPLAKLFTLSIACNFFLGIQEYSKIAKLVKSFDDVTLGLHCMPVNFPGTVFYRASKAAAIIRKELIEIVKQKKQALSRGVRGSDILSFMIMAGDGSGSSSSPQISQVEIVDKMMGLLLAGYSTVATAITFVIKYMGETPQVYQQVLLEQKKIAASKSSDETLNWEDIQRMKYSWSVVSEAMRLTPPLQGTFREALTDISYQGFTIPKGWKIYWTVSTTNMDADYFPNPERFDPSRYEEGNMLESFTYLPFGGGPRSCPGKEYSRVVILSFLHNMVMKFKWEIVFPNEKIINDMMPMPAQGLPVRLINHAPSS
ncbi:Cytochrome P450 [Dillenia turbinata]|uniref:Cytochrome P450 n=1 Tax=Dillenia turbinata TaxID=194707 RepID=A0AAN8VPF7_9MAGN